MQKHWIKWASFHGFFAVAMGAFGAHALKSSTAGLPPDEATKILGWVETASRYQLLHAAALLGLAALMTKSIEAAAKRTGLAWAWGTLVFSATLYAMALGAPRWFGAITPLGGLALLFGWLNLAFIKK